MSDDRFEPVMVENDWYDGPRRSDRLAVGPGAIRELRLALAGNPSLPALLIGQLIAVADPELCLALTERDDFTDTQVNRLMVRGGSQVTVRLIQRGMLTADRVDASDPEMIVALAEHGVIPTEWAWQVAHDPDPRIRARLAEATHTPLEVLAHLAEDAEVEVIAAVAGFARLSAGLAEQLARHPHMSVRRAVACNEYTPEDLLRALCAGQGAVGDALPSVRRLLAWYR